MDNKVNYDKMEIVTMHMYKRHNENGKYEHYDAYDSLLNPLSILLTKNITDVQIKKEKLNHYGFKITDEEVDTMCNLSEGIYNDGIEKGKIELIHNLMDSMKVSMEEAFNLLKIDEKEREVFKTLIQE